MDNTQIRLKIAELNGWQTRQLENGCMQCAKKGHDGKNDWRTVYEVPYWPTDSAAALELFKEMGRGWLIVHANSEELGKELGGDYGCVKDHEEGGHDDILERAICLAYIPWKEHKNGNL